MQRASTKLEDVEQLALLPDRPKSKPVDLARIALLQSTTEALEYGCTLAGLVPKKVYQPMDCDKGTWSRICGGEWDLDGRDIYRFDRVVGNDAYLLYLNHQHGYDLGAMRKTLDDKDRVIAQQAETIADQERSIRLLVNAMKERA